MECLLVTPPIGSFAFTFTFKEHCQLDGNSIILSDRDYTLRAYKDDTLIQELNHANLLIVWDRLPMPVCKSLEEDDMIDAIYQSISANTCENINRVKISAKAGIR